MSRTVLPLHAEDISALARSLRGQLATCQQPPSHLEMLNMLARANGYRNFQHLRSQVSVPERVPGPQPAPSPPPVDAVKLKRLARFFDDQGRLLRWPGKLSQRVACLWVIWSKLPPRQRLSPEEVRRMLEGWHLFGDHALLRRFLCDLGLAGHTAEGREYWRVERQPPPEALALIRHLSGGAPS
ncbi:MAG: DUF2087 domain-containing protein [Desulfarculus sp.]|nr:DUF2087 domain-containing protein [Desulfarculus sp.]